MNDQIKISEEKHEFQAEITELLKLISNSLYVNKEVFIRELISNSSDACNKLRFHMLTDREVLDSDVPFEIEIEVDNDKQQLIFRDTGIGMDREEIIENIGIIASSGTKKFLSGIEKGKEISKDDIIGHFGVGFYSVFMVAESVIIKSRSYKKDVESIIWESDGSSSFTVKNGEKSNRGTEVILQIKDDSKDFLSKDKIKEVVKKYSSYITFPIKFSGEEDLLNQEKAIWRRTSKEIEDEEYDEFFRHLAPTNFGKPLLRQHYSTDLPFQYYSLLYIPETMNSNVLDAEWGLKLYSKNVLIQDTNKELLPEYFRFVKGVVDAEDLPLNVSREVVQIDRKLLKIKKALTGKLIKEIENLAKNDSDTYNKIWEQYSIFFKQGVIIDESRRDRLLDLLRFNSSSIKENQISMKEYIENMKENQDGIFYLLGDDLEAMRKNPILEYYSKNEFNVLLMNDASDAFLMTNIFDYSEKKFVNIDQAETKKSDETSTENEGEDDKEKDEKDVDPLLKKIKEILKEKITDVSYTDALSESPCRVLNPSSAIPTNMQKVFQYMNTGKEQNIMTAGPKKFEINPNHTIITNLKRILDEDSSDANLDLIIYHLFESTMILDGNTPKTSEFVPNLQKLLEEYLTKV